MINDWSKESRTEFARGGRERHVHCMSMDMSMSMSMRA